jgi:PAS domain S-box-containing protein
MSGTAIANQIGASIDGGAAASNFALDADLLDLVQESLVVFGLDGRIKRWNKASERIYGWSRAQAEGRYFDEVLRGRRWPDTEQMLQLGSSHPSWIELRRKTALGEDVVVTAQLSLRHDASGKPFEFVETAVDVTAQRRAESAAEVGQQHYRNVFKAIPASVWDVDFSEARSLVMGWLKSASADPRPWLVERPERVRELMRATYVRDVNERAMELFGPCERETLLVSVERYWPESSTADFADWVVSSLSGETYFSRETRQRRYDGREFDALFTASYAPGTVNEGRLVVTIVDYTDVKRDQAAVRKSEAFYTDLFHGSAFSAWHMDARPAWAIFHKLYERGVTDLRAHLDRNRGLVFEIMDGIRVVDVNDTTLRLFCARDRSEIVGGSIVPFWFPDRMEPLLSSLAAAFSGIPTYQGLASMRTLAGDEIDVLFTRSASTALSSAGQVLLAIVDMSDKIQAQKALAEMQANFAHAARVSSLGELTASIAHEVNQPLAAITANGEAALSWLGRATPDLDKVCSLTNEMIADARRASDIVAHIRSMASPQFAPHRRLSLNALVEDALTLLGSELEKGHALAVRDLHGDLPDVLGDPVQLQQVIVNLVLNALQAMGGKAGSRLVLRTDSQANSVILTVADNGPGIQPKNFERLFGSFFTTKPDGMGIGLSICRTIVEAHGGAISALNLESRGACFEVRLPQATRPQALT